MLNIITQMIGNDRLDLRFCLRTGILIILELFIFLYPGFSQTKVIFDTDIGPDWDDVGATAVLHALYDKGEAEILAMMVSSGGHSATWGPPCLDAFNTYYDRPDIPIGVASNGPSFGSKYNQQIAEEFPQDLGTDGAWDAVTLYRNVLSQQPDTSVVVITVGFLTNLANLLKSQPDTISTLNGLDLVKNKVKKWVCMGGGYPSSGGEFNFIQDAASTKFVVENWPRPVLFSGFEIGSPIKTGSKLAQTSPLNPFRRAYELAGGYVGSTRPSWDQTAVLAAVRNPLIYWDMQTTGYCYVAEDGSNTWYSTPDSDDAYLISKLSNEEMQNIIDDLMANLNGIPQIEMISPLDGDTFNEGDNILLKASAADSNGQVVKVQFFTQAGILGEVLTAPYELTWNNVKRGRYQIWAEVTDDEGLTNQSSSIYINVGDINTSLIGHWMFENNAGDSSDYNNSGTVSGSPGYVPGRVGNAAIQFNNAQDYITISQSRDFSMTSLTISVWVKFPSSISSSWRTIVEHNRWGSNWFGLWKSANGNTFHFRWGNNGNMTSDFNTLITPDTWYHVAATYDSLSQTANLYLNANLDKKVTGAPSPVVTLSGLTIGINQDHQEELNGVIDDLRIYNRALSKEEISALYSNASDISVNENAKNNLPRKYALSNYPNPFNPRTTVCYSLPKQSRIHLEIYDVSGKLMTTLIEDELPAGEYTIEFDGQNYPSGIYFYLLRTKDFSIMKKMVLVK